MVSLLQFFDVDISCLLSLSFAKFFSLLLQILLLGYETGNKPRLHFEEYL